MLINSHYWLAGWYAVRTHAVAAEKVESPVAGDLHAVSLKAVCGATVYSEPKTEWAAKRIAKGLPQCKRCLMQLGQTETVEQHLKARVRELEAGLRALANEVHAIGAFEEEVRTAVGHTNFTCLMQCKDEARRLLEGK